MPVRAAIFCTASPTSENAAAAPAIGAVIALPAAISRLPMDIIDEPSCPIRLLIVPRAANSFFGSAPIST